MYKVFNEELDALMYGIGKSPNLSIDLPKGLEILKCYGYKPKLKSTNYISIALNNLGASSTLIVLLKVKGNPRSEGTIYARLGYHSGDQFETVTKSAKYDSKTAKTNDEVQKNFDIAFMAQNLKDAALASNHGNDYKMRSILDNTINWMKDSPFFDDSDFRRVYDIVTLYAPEKAGE
jgi:hypothetical protein